LITQHRPTRRTLAGTGTVLALAAAGTHVAIVAARTPVLPTATGTPTMLHPARAARSLRVDDTGHLHLLNASNSILLEEGPVSGTLPGRTRVRLDVGANVTASFTIDSRGGGSISGYGSAALHNSSRYSSFGGSLSVSHGTGRYAHAHGVGKLYGVIDRRTDEVTVQAIGTLHY
jgi:hypothetical protein